MKTDIPRIIRRINHNRVLVALPNYPQPVAMDIIKFESLLQRYL